MRILHILDHSLPLHSGYTFRSRALIQEQRNRGWDTVQVTTPRHIRSGPDPETADGLSFHRTRPPKGIAAKLPLISILVEIAATAARIDEIIEIQRPDILHAHSPVLNAMAALKAGKRHNIPVVYEIRGTWEDAAVANGTQVEGSMRYRLTRALETYAIKRVAGLFVICDGLRKEMLSRGANPDTLAVIPNAVDIDRFTPILQRDVEIENRLGLSGMEVVGFLGSFYDYEGLDTLIEAIALLSNERPTLRALLVGGGPQEEALKAQVRQLGLEDRVLMLGRVPNTEVDRYYSVIDLLVYPRKRCRVTELVTPLKPLESMAQAKLVIASDVGGHRELIRSGETGELFAADDPKSIAQTIVRMFANRASWPVYQENGLRFVRAERTWKHSVDNYIPVYERVLTKRKG